MPARLRHVGWPRRLVDVKPVSDSKANEGQLGAGAPGDTLKQSNRMISKRRSEIERLLKETLARPVEEQEAFLSQTCGADAELRTAVQSLLKSTVDATPAAETLESRA